MPENVVSSIVAVMLGAVLGALVQALFALDRTIPRVPRRSDESMSSYARRFVQKNWDSGPSGQGFTVTAGALWGLVIVLVSMVAVSPIRFNGWDYLALVSAFVAAFFLLAWVVAQARHGHLQLPGLAWFFPGPTLGSNELPTSRPGDDEKIV